MEMDTERNSEKSDDEVTQVSKAAQYRKKLMVAADYAVDAFSPVVAVIALIVAVIAFNGNKSGQTLVGQSASRLDSMSTNMSATKSELEKLRVTLGKDKTMQEEERKHLDERLAKIIRAISQLQTKAKISPTLEDQFNQPVVKAAATTAAAPLAPPAKAPVVSGPEKKAGEQAKILKEAIDKFNKK